MRAAARILVVDDEPGMVRAVERVLGAAHDVVGSQSSPDGAGHRPPVRSRPRHPRREDAGDRRLRADGAAESGAARRRHHRHDRQPRRPRSEADSGDPRPRLLFHPEAVRPRGAADAGRALSRAALAPRSRAGSTSSGSSGSWPTHAPSSRACCRCRTWSSTASPSPADTSRAWSSAAISATTCRSVRAGSRWSSPT